jgi:hypothetical protein
MPLQEVAKKYGHIFWLDVGQQVYMTITLFASKQDLESPLYLLLVALVPLFSSLLFKDPVVLISKKIEALSSKVPHLWKYDILSRIAFSLGCGIDTIEHIINILLSHCRGLRKDSNYKSNTGAQ